MITGAENLKTQYGDINGAPLWLGEMAKRDEFTPRTVMNIARRVNYHCSMPQCGVSTQAPHSDPAKFINLGEAAHITAAAPGGPRYDLLLSREQRRHASNGIWMCRLHARLVDADDSRYTVDELRDWKMRAEEKTFNLTVLKAIQPNGEPQIASDIADVFAHLGNCAKEDLSKFVQAEAWPMFAIHLNLVLTGEREQAFDVDGLAGSIETFNEIVIVAPPGTGKSVTLLQLTGAIIERGANVPFFIPLSEWATGTESFLQSLLKRRSFIEAKIEHLQLLAANGKMLLVLDGWNELDESSRNRARAQVSELQRDYPDIRIVISSRSTEFDLPIEGPVVKIGALTEEQQVEIAGKLRGKDGEALVDHAWRTPGLRELVSIPLYLIVLLRHVTGGTLPTTKEELLRAFAHGHEENPGKAEKLRSDLQGFHMQYLAALAAEATAQETTALNNKSARRVVNTVQNDLKAQDQIALLAQPQKILDVLANAHLLVLSHEETGSVMFQHQQFQEWYASFWVQELIYRFAAGNPDARKELRSSVLDIPFWEESILFACERLSRMGDDRATEVARVIVEALGIDPLLSAEIIYRSSEETWQKVKNEVLDFAGRWHGGNRVDRAVHFMISSGRPEFSDVVWPLISNPDQQVHLQALRAGKRFRTGILGADVSKRIAPLSEELRKHILSEIAGKGGIDGIELATSITKEDPSEVVKIAVLESLLFRRADRAASTLLDGASDNVWHTLAEHWDEGDFDNTASKARIREEKQKQIETQRPQRHIERLLRDTVRSPEKGEKISRLLQDVDFSDRDSDVGWIAHRAYEQYPRETVDALISVLEAGKAIPFRSEEMLQNSGRSMDEGPIAQRVLQSIEHGGKINSEAYVIGPNTIGALIERSIELDTQLAQAEAAARQDLWKELSRLSALISKTNPEAFASAVLNMLPIVDERQVALFAELISHHGDRAERNVIELVEEKRTQLVDALIQWGQMLLESPHASRAQMAEIPQAAKRLGSVKLLPVLDQLLRKDVALRNAALEEAQEARSKGKRADNDAHIVWSHMYTSAFSAIGGEQAVALMKPHMENLEFGVEAASVLRAVWRATLQEDEDKQEVLRPSPDFSEVKARRAARQAGRETDTHPFVNEILAVTYRLLASDSNEMQKHGLRLAAIAFSMPHADIADEISMLLDLPRPAEDKSELLTSLVLSGHVIPAHLVLSGIDELYEEAKTKPWLLHDGEGWRLIKWMKLLAFTDSPDSLIDVLPRTAEVTRAPWSLRQVMYALGHSPSDNIEETLLSLARNDPRFLKQYEWLGALSRRGTIEAARALLEFLCDEASDAKIVKENIHDLGRQIAGFISMHEVFRADVYLKYQKVPEGPSRAVLEIAIAEVADKDGLLILVREAAAQKKSMRNTVIYSALREFLIGRRASVSWAGSQELFGLPSLDLRKGLFKLFTQGSAEESALAAKCLVAIDEIRDDYGYTDSDRRHPDIESGIPWP